jgi:hypothetical protein
MIRIINEPFKWVLENQVPYGICGKENLKSEGFASWW